MRGVGRALRLLSNQETARSNAAEASAELRIRRHEQEAVAAYLEDGPGSEDT
jgi:hypothetical protein